MSKPLTADQFHALVVKSGITVTWYDGWRTRNRGQRGDGWGLTTRNPTGVHGVVLHHTVTRDVARTISVVRDIGQPENDVPAPLYNGIVDKSGRLHMLAWGRVNHAGLGDDDVLRAVVAEGDLPAPNEANTDGNARFYGFAGVNMGDGRDPWPHAQQLALARVAAAVCRGHGWTHRSIIGHREWTNQKVDPLGPEGNLMPALRNLAREALR